MCSASSSIALSEARRRAPQLSTLRHALTALQPPNSAARPSRAATDVLKEFGMLGRIAVNCAAPASAGNPHVTFAGSSKGGMYG